MAAGEQGVDRVDGAADTPRRAARSSHDAPCLELSEGAFAGGSESGVITVELLVVLGLFAVVVPGLARVAGPGAGEGASCTRLGGGPAVDAGPDLHGDRPTLPCPLQPGADLAHPAPDGLHGAGPAAQGCRTRRGRRGHVDQGDVAAGGKTVRDQDAWLCFADEAGQMFRAPKART